MVDLEDEADRATAMLMGKSVVRGWRHRVGEVLVEFSDGTRLFVDVNGNEAELSITSGSPTEVQDWLPSRPCLRSGPVHLGG